MRCKCGHAAIFHDGPCEECDCTQFEADPNWEPPDPPGWEGGFADNH
jgi:hypothetical protein